jgi:hypothetical protein
LAKLSYRRRVLILEAAAWLLFTRLSLSFFPFPRLRFFFGTFVSPTDTRVLQIKSEASHRQTLIAEEVSWAVTRAARYAPFSALCLPQAMAAKLMLKRRGIPSALHFGASPGQCRPFDLHAWLDTAGVEVTGYPVANTFTEIGVFV